MKKKVVRTTKKSAQGVAKYGSVRQRRCWAMIVEALQEYIPTMEDIDWKTANLELLRKYFPLNEKGELEVPVNAKYIVSGKRSVKPTLLKMKTVDVVDDIDDKGALHTYPLFYDIIDHQNGKYSVGIAPRSLCWVLNLSKEMGYVSFCVESFMRILRPSAMMTYLYISSNLNRVDKDGNKGRWTVNVEDMRKWVGCPETYRTNDFIVEYLVKAKKEFERVGTRLSFSASVVTKKSDLDARNTKTSLEFTVTDYGSPRSTTVDDDCYEEEDDTPVQSEKDRWEEWDRIVAEERKKFERH